MEQFILGVLDTAGKIDFGSVWSIFLYALAVFWVVVLYWIWLDSGDRTSNKYARIGYVVLATVFNVVGLVIYLIIRPSQTIEEIYWSDLERRYLKYETSELGDCPKCGTQLYPGFRFCPECKYVLKTKCGNCNIYMDNKYKYCPHCGEHVQNVSIQEDSAPTKEMMQEQIDASREEATEIVETSRTRYTVQKGIAVKVGSLIVNTYTSLATKIKDLFGKKEATKIVVEKRKKNKKKKRK